MDRKSQLLVVNEICEMKSCNKCIFLVGKKKRDVYMWLSNVPHGPSALFYVDYCKYYYILRIIPCLETKL